MKLTRRRLLLLLPVLFLVALAIYGGLWADRMLDHLGCRNLAADVVTIPPLQGERVRFVAVGDAGAANPGQRKLAGQMGRTCAELGCDFALLLGDNFYKHGVKSVDDPQFQSTFETVYAPLGIPFYPVLGNHDTHGGGARFQPLYSARSRAWRMPNFTYGFEGPSARFLALNTNCNAIDLAGLRDRLEEAPREPEDERWVVVFGHHTLYSTGNKGDADALSRWYWRTFLRERIDLYLSGHAHELERLARAGGRADYVISGAGSQPEPSGRPKTRSADGVESLFRYQELGFAWFEITPRRIHAKFIAADGRLLYEFSKEKNSGENPGAAPPAQPSQG